MSRIHKLKCYAKYFDAIVSGDKCFEVRKNDRGYEVGDELHLVRTDGQGVPTTPPHEIVKRVHYILEGGSFGIVPNHVVMGFARSASLDEFDDDAIEKEFEKRFGVADYPIERIYRLLADGEVNEAMDEMARCFDLPPPYVEKGISALIAKGRAKELAARQGALNV